MKNGDSLKVSVAPTLRKQIADTLRNAIALGEFDAGERLVERVLCERIGCSRTSLREALRELENEGLITNLPNRGLIVATLTKKEARAIFEVRAALEALICRLFCEKATPEDLQECQNAFEGVVAAYEAGVPRDMIIAKSRLYDVLMAGADSVIAERMLRSIHIRVSQLRVMSLASTGRREASLQELRALVECLLARDAKRAEELSRHHVEQATESALARLD
ncbi:GntR family transcriptional regulator [Azospirillum canadense]|uniref:GntR family transcriptional regulator n=1 Tax=Azospirillum canadense TaxID=403962 RepID=UPI002226A6E1|nr:GntR family transcriptional regulator [Azospirillum canadense]MCW2242334.1 DNA-binding GntR family transcriptional regulator [Azospirillum canadense]